MPDHIVRQAYHRVLHAPSHLKSLSADMTHVAHFFVPYLAETLRFCVFLKTERGKVNTSPEDFRLGKNADASNTINLHFHVRVAVRIAKVGQMWSPCGIFRITLHDDGVFIKSIG